MKKNLMALTILFFLAQYIHAQDKIQLILTACNATSNTLDFDLIIRNDGDKAMVLGSAAIGIDLDYTGIGVGNMELKYVEGSGELNSQQNNYTNKTSVAYSEKGNPRINAISHSILIAPLVANRSGGTPMAGNKEYRIGTFRLTNTSGTWTAHSHPNFTFVHSIRIPNRQETKIIEYYDVNKLATTWSSNTPEGAGPVPEIIKTPCSNNKFELN